MTWSYMQSSKSLRPTQISEQEAKHARQNGISSLLMKRQLLICLLQYSIIEISKAQWLSA